MTDKVTPLAESLAEKVAKAQGYAKDSTEYRQKVEEIAEELAEYSEDQIDAVIEYFENEEEARWSPDMLESTENNLEKAKKQLEQGFGPYDSSESAGFGNGDEDDYKESEPYQSSEETETEPEQEDEEQTEEDEEDEGPDGALGSNPLD